jgi:6-phosphogluconolactonase (cycloisomerase 2 family)
MSPRKSHWSRRPVATAIGVVLLVGGCEGLGGRADESSEAFQELLREHLIQDHSYYTISGYVTGLKDSKLVLRNNGGDDLNVASDGAFTFATALPNGSGYAVTVEGWAATPGEGCTVGNGTGTLSGAHISDVSIVCGVTSEPIAAAAGDAQPNASIADAPPVGATPEPDMADEPAGDEPAVNEPAAMTPAVYVAGNSDVSQYTMNADGALTPMTPASVGLISPVDGKVEQASNSCIVHPSGRYLYVANFFGWDGLSQFNIGADGGLTPMTPPTVSVAGNGASVAVDPSGSFANVAGFGGGLSQFTVGVDGTLAPMTPPTVTAGTQPIAITVDPAGRHAYVANFSGNDVSQYTIGGDGTLTPMTPPTVAAGTNPWFVAVHPSGRYAYVANVNSGNVSQYTIEDGNLTPMDSATVATGEYGASWIGIDPSGRYAYVANSNKYNSNNVSQFVIGTDGGLIPMGVVTVVGEEPKCVAIRAGRP